MIQLHAVYLILLAEAAVLLLALSAFLGWRLLRRPPPTLTTPEDLQGHARRFLESELMRTEALLEDDPELEEERRERLERRRTALEAELAALELGASETAFWERVESGYETPPGSTEPVPEDAAPEPEPEQEEMPATAEPATETEDANAALEALKADYQALLQTLGQVELAEAARQEVDTATERWHQRLVVIERELRESALGVGGGRRSGGVTLAESGDRDRLRQIIGQQDELIWDLKKDMASAINDSEKLGYLEERVENIMRQARELQACVNVLEDENNFLFQQLRERDAGDGAPGDSGADNASQAHVSFLLANQEEALASLGTAIDGLEASDTAAEDVMRARSALAELLTCTESLHSSLRDDTVEDAPAAGNAGTTES